MAEYHEMRGVDYKYILATVGTLETQWNYVKEEKDPENELGHGKVCCFI